ncbi:uncharacterized protein B0I36DRAFT_387428 [Microdochium trichocladiopsis]|uniref:BZIP domain-containing protein n=1 Tax=Microdochium trichocladiopsis TaxID=1682393 RepID=A0A9P8Y0M6_9PEZI|nr:uncharacterized protein B0I36DRAFT_387428 [Microdochium trichocladiopsis]KAH7025048.1 hypothetical protein B0I36DRAFT_387428 [Microdochium trichocladiopsis]
MATHYMEQRDVDDDLSASSPATTVHTQSTTAHAGACFSPFTDASAPSTVSSAPSSPAAYAGNKKQQHHSRRQIGSIDSIAGGSSSATTAHEEDEWQHITDPRERRKVQNRIAQRKYREKAALKRETERRDARNQQLAGGSYARPWVTSSSHDETATASSSSILPRPLDNDAEQHELNGVPWGGLVFSRPPSMMRTQTQHGSWQAEQEEMRRQFMDRQRLLWQRQQMQMHRRHRLQQQEQQQQQQQQQQAHAKKERHKHKKTQRQHVQDGNVHTAGSSSALASSAMPSLLQTQHGGFHSDGVPQTIQGQMLPGTATGVATSGYQNNMFFVAEGPQSTGHLPPTGGAMDAFFRGSVFYDSSVQSLWSEYTPIDPSLLVNMGGGAMMHLSPAFGAGHGQHVGGDGGLVDSIMLDDDAGVEDELLAWPD